MVVFQNKALKNLLTFAVSIWIQFSDLGLNDYDEIFSQLPPSVLDTTLCAQDCKIQQTI